jgi:hypothetical protein
MQGGSRGGHSPPVFATARTWPGAGGLALRPALLAFDPLAAEGDTLRQGDATLRSEEHAPSVTLSTHQVKDPVTHRWPTTVVTTPVACGGSCVVHSDSRYPTPWTVCSLGASAPSFLRSARTTTSTTFEPIAAS